MSTLRSLPVLVLALLVAATSAAQQISSPRAVSLHTPDGTVLKGTYFASRKPGPGVLLLHQCNQQRKLWDVLGERLASSGINVFTFDYRGFGESGGIPHDKLTPEEENKIQTEAWPSDIELAFQYLLAQPGVAGERIGVGGASCGVYNAIKLARRHPEVKSLVLLAGPTDDSQEKPDTVASFLCDLKMDFPTGIDTGSIGKQYGVNGLPTTVLIGVDGKVQFYEEGALANADVAFDPLLQKNLQLLKTGKTISTEDYRILAKQQPSLPGTGTETNGSSGEGKLSPRAEGIATRMDCTCGCDKKVQICTCNASTKIKHALATENIDGKPDAEVMKSLNKRFCMEAM